MIFIEENLAKNSMKFHGIMKVECVCVIQKESRQSIHQGIENHGSRSRFSSQTEPKQKNGQITLRCRVGHC